MKCSYDTLAGSALLCLLLLAIPSVGQNESSGGKASNKTNFKKGQLLNIENVQNPYKNSEKAGYLFTIQDGDSQYFGHYTLNYFQHDRSKQLEKGKEVEYRIDGKHLILRTPDGEEIKMQLCERRGNCTKCGGDAFC